MNIDEALRGLGESPGEPAVDIEAGRERLRGAARRLHDDPLEARRIDNLAKRVDRHEKDCRLGHVALEKRDYRAAERYLRRAAQHGNDEAAYWLGLLLEMRSIRQHLKGRPDKARKLAAEAREWRLRAQESGIADVLNEIHACDAPSLPRPAQLPALRQNRPRGDRRARDVTSSPHQQAVAGGEGRYAVGIEVQPYQFTTVLINEDGEIISQEADELSDMKPGAVVSVLAAAALGIVASRLGEEFPAHRVALGVQLGAPVDTEAGTVHYYSKHPPSDSTGECKFQWENLPFGPQLQRETGLPTVVLNDAVAFAERERWLGVGRQTGDFVVMLVREGVGGAVVSNGEHFPGPVEIGNFRFGSSNIEHIEQSLEQSDAHQFDVLELASGTTGVTKYAGRRAKRTFTDIQAAADAADEDGPGREAAGAFLWAGVAIACGLSYLVQFAGPSHAVLCAPEVMLRPDRRASRNFLSQVREFREAVTFEAYRNCELVLRATDPNDGAQGAALAALSRCFGVEPTASPISAGVTR